MLSIIIEKNAMNEASPAPAVGGSEALCVPHCGGWRQNLLVAMFAGTTATLLKGQEQEKISGQMPSHLANSPNPDRPLVRFDVQNSVNSQRCSSVPRSRPSARRHHSAKSVHCQQLIGAIRAGN
jgi:hypothetical protein